MHQQDREDYIQRYQTRLAQYGYSPESLGWGKHGRQEIRFQVLAQHALEHPNSSVLDVGCGFADLYDFLKQRGWQGTYTGVDIVPDLLAVARERHPELRLYEQDITEQPLSLEPHDFVIASGIFNARLPSGDSQITIRQSLHQMFNLAHVAVAVDFLSKYVDFEKPESWHTHPGWALELGMSLSKRAVLRHDYMPYEFALFIFKDTAVSSRNVFQAFEETSNA